MRERPSVLLVQPLLAHYREELLTLLAQDDRMSLKLAAGDSSSDGIIQTFDVPGAIESLALKNRYVGMLLWQRGLVQELLRGKYDALVITGSVHHLSTWVCLLLAPFCRTRTYLWTTGWHRPDSGAKRLVRLAFYNLAHHLLLYGDWGYELGVQSGFPRRKMTVVYNSVQSPDITTVAQVRQEEPVKIVFVGRLTKEKELDLLLHAVAAGGPRLQQAQVIIAGDGPALRHLENLAERLRVKVNFVGGVYDPKSLADIYRRARMTVIPGRAGLTVIQSIGHGVPVVTHSRQDLQVAEAEAVVIGITGERFNYGDVESLSGAMNRIADLDDDAFRSLQTATRQAWLSRWSAAAQAERIASAVLVGLRGPRLRRATRLTRASES
ncbi:glycosyltransferase family 4 protein [Frigoribacterium faeni]|uniref:glycosyltransferase family 4 protein n=1 Tax=Frigoribacterium faeni TaxID=145483 RepID=UPI0024131DBA|nr:glycosyltransferase family 4 protein [Frigoribacterium faeni]